MTPAIDDSSWRPAARAVLAEYPLRPTQLARIPQGLINLTVAVTAGSGARYVLQRLNPVFDDGVNANLAYVTAHLAARGLITPLLVETRSGARSVRHDGALWRVLTWVEGRALDRLERPAQAYAAGALLGRFHAALGDYGGPLVAGRAPVHELERHRAHLAGVLAATSAHPALETVRELAAAVERALAAVPAFTPGPPRLVHGDPKISNVLFAPHADDAVCLIDLDTLARMPLVFELGDALRSWCNPAGEDAAAARFDLELLGAAIAGYRRHAGALAAHGELAAVVAATRVIHLELALRFLADAIEDRYFAWDPRRYPDRPAHNLARARGQLAAEASLAAQHAAAERLVLSRAEL